MIKLVLFDLDGVLINSLPNMRKALKLTSKKINVKLSFKEYKKFLGLPFEKILEEQDIIHPLRSLNGNLFIKKTGFFKS